MNFLKNTLLITCLFFGLVCHSQKAERYVIYGNDISLHGDFRKLFLEFDKEDPSKIRWGIEKAGRHRLPLINTTFNRVSNLFSGDLSFFGSEVFGKITGTFATDKINGHLVWHGDTISFSLVQIKRKLAYKEEEISFSNGDLILKGTLILPTEISGPFPAVVFAHGSGPFTRWWGMYWGAAFSKIGVATLLHDKRGCGESDGNWVQSSLNDLANDVISGIDFLAQHPSIDKHKIGVYGVSQGGWVASRVSALTNKLAFVISNSGGGVRPFEENIYSHNINMKFAGIDEKGRTEGLSLVKKHLQYLASGERRNELKEAMENAKNKDWYPVLGLDRVFVSADNRVNWEWVATYDPKVDIREMKMPVLLLFGDQDHDQPTDVSIMNWKQGLDEADNTKYQVNIFEGAGHGLVIGGHHVKGFPKYAEGHIETIKDWMVEFVLSPD